MGEPLVEGTASEVSTDNPIQGDREQDPMSIPVENNIHGGEYTIDNTNDDEYELAEYARIAAERIEAIEDLPLPDTLEVSEETVIAWAAQNGGNLINIRREER